MLLHSARLLIQQTRHLYVRSMYFSLLLTLFHNLLRCNGMRWWINWWARQNRFRGFSKLWFPRLLYRLYKWSAIPKIQLLPRLLSLRHIRGVFRRLLCYSLLRCHLSRRAVLSLSRRGFQTVLHVGILLIGCSLNDALEYVLSNFLTNFRFILIILGSL